MMTKSNFFRILKEIGAYSSFIKYVKRRFAEYNDFTEIYCNSVYTFIDNNIRRGSPQEIIMEGFTWADTAEGEDFWSNLYSEMNMNKRRNEK